MEKNESHIILNVLAGKTDEFAYFLDTYGQAVYGLVVSMVGSEADAEELTQDAFMRAFRNLGSFRGQSSFLTWIYRIAYNVAISFLRRQRQEDCTADDRFWANVADTQVDEALDDATDDRIACLERAVQRLSAEERALLTLFYEEGKTLQEVAHILDLTPGTAKVRLHRLRKKLYVMMQNEEETDR